MFYIVFNRLKNKHHRLKNSDIRPIKNKWLFLTVNISFKFKYRMIPINKTLAVIK